MDAPSGQLFPAHLGILGATECGDRTVKWFPMLVCVSLANSEISPEEGKIHLHELWLLQNFLGRSSQSSELGQDLLIRQLVNLNVPVRKLWRPMPGYDHMDRASDALGP